jgi:hypothetical protein
MQQETPPSLIITGTSMSPVLLPGDKVILEQNGKTELNDLVCFRSPQDNMPVVHRVVWLGEIFFISRGDHRLLPDTAMPCSAILGKVIQILPGRRKPPYPLQGNNNLIGWLLWLLLKIKLIFLDLKGMKK